ncbi:glycosyltransferase family 4 protein [Modestobacter lapidis]
MARSLADAAIEQRHECLIVGGEGQPVTIENAIGWSQRPLDGIFGRAVTASRWTIGASPDYRRLGSAPRSSIGQYADLVIAHNQPWTGAALRRLFPRSRLVLYVHNRILNGVRARIAQRRLADFDHVICVSNYIRDDLVKRTGIPAGKTTTVLNGVNPLRFPNRDRAIDITFVGRMSEEKGPHVLLESLEYLGDLGSSLRIQLIGASWFHGSEALTDYEKRLRALAGRLPQEVSFVGRQNPAEVAEHFAATKVAVVPSIWPDPCPLTIYEAMAAGAALVATDTGGIPELCEGAAVIIPRNDAQALAKALRSLLVNPKLTAKIASTGRARARSRPWSTVWSEALSASVI